MYRILGLGVTLSLLVLARQAHAGQPLDINSLAVGTRYCPAPWADNSEFLDTYYSVDAKTGKVTRHSKTTDLDSAYSVPESGEQVLFSCPPISVENRYVPYPGAAPQPAPTFLGQVRQIPAQPAPVQAGPGLNPGERLVYAPPQLQAPNQQQLAQQQQTLSQQQYIAQQQRIAQQRQLAARQQQIAQQQRMQQHAQQQRYTQQQYPQQQQQQQRQAVQPYGQPRTVASAPLPPFYPTVRQQQ